MKSLIMLGLVAVLLGGCAYPAYYDARPQYPYQAPQAQYAPQQVAPVGCIQPYVPSWNGCALPVWPQYIAPMYGGYYAPGWYGDPLFRFNFNFGGKHRGGGHRR